MEQKPTGENPGNAQTNPEIIISSPSTGGTMPASNRICPSCGTLNPPGSVYCYKCGLKLPEAALSDKKICTGCGAANATSSQYCYKCGLLLPEKLGGGIENKVKYGGFGVRFVAFLIDGILLYILISIVSAIVYNMIYGSSYYSSLLSALESSGLIPASLLWSFVWVGTLTSFVIGTLYYTIAIGKWGKTIGKAALKLKILKPDGSRVSYWRALGRSLAYILNWFTFGLSFLIIAFTNKKRSLHDYIADTIVIKTE